MNYITNFSQIRQEKLTIFMQMISRQMGLICWRIWRFLCKLHHQRWAQHVGEYGDFGEFYANYITRDGPNMLANMAILASFMLITSGVTRVEQKASIFLEWNRKQLFFRSKIK